MTAAHHAASNWTAPRRGRPPKAQAVLSRVTVREAALHVIDADGIAAVTMRSVSAVLGVDPKSLYHHVSGKDDLLDAVAEHLLAQLELPRSTGVLETDLKAMAVEFRRVTLAHPEAASLVLTRQLSSLAGLAPIESVLSVLLNKGASQATAVHLLRAVLACLIGTLLREVSAGPTFGASDASAIAGREADLASAGLPAVSAAAHHLARFDRDEEFEFTLDLIVRAVRAQLSEGEGTSA